MALDLEAINKAVRDVINLIVDDSSYNVVKAYQDAPRPKSPYASVHIGNTRKIGTPEKVYGISPLASDLPLELRNIHEIYVDVNFYRKNAASVAQMVNDALWRDSVLDILASAGIGLGKYDNVKSLPSAHQGKWEERAMFGLMLYAVSSDSEILNPLETANISGVQVEENVLAIDINVQSEESQ